MAAGERQGPPAQGERRDGPAARLGPVAVERPLPAWLFVPGAEERFMAKLQGRGARRGAPGGEPARAGAATFPPPDVIVLDLEDGVAPSESEAARERVARALHAPWDGHVAPLAVRTHAVGHELFAGDLDALGPGLFALVLPKVASPDGVRSAADELERRGLDHVGLVPMIESAAGLEAAAAVLLAHPSVAAVALGAEDLAADLGLPPAGMDPETDAARERVMDHVRSRLVVAAAAAGVQRRIDSPTLALRDVERVTRDARRARAMGFGAKFAVHPAQVGPIRQGLLPSAVEVAWARDVLASAGAGAQAQGGRMVDEAVARQARNVLSAAGDEGDGAGG